jgi:hypothetical protein
MKLSRRLKGVLRKMIGPALLPGAIAGSINP